MHAHSCWDDGRQIQVCHSQSYRIGDRKGIKHRKMPCCDFTKSSLWQLVCYGCQVWATSSLTYDSSKNTLASWKDSWVSRKVLIPTACSAKQVKCPSFPIDLDASYDSEAVYSLQTILFLRKLCGLTFFLQTEVIHGLIRFCSRSKNSLRLSNFWMPFDFASLSIWNSSSSLYANISLGAGEDLTFWHRHETHPYQQNFEDLPHTIWCTVGDCSWPVGLQKKKSKACVASIFTWIFPTISAVHFLALAFLAITFWFKECVRTGIEGLMRSDLWHMWLAHCLNWGTHFTGLSEWTSCQPSHTAPPAGLPTSVWG